MKVSVTVCDVCRDPKEETRTYRVSSEGKIASVDLCHEHGEPLERHLGPGKVTAVTRGRRRGTGVVSLEEIEKSKKKQ